MKIEPTLLPLTQTLEKKEEKSKEDIFDLDLRVSASAKKQFPVNELTNYCGSNNDDCTGCGCNTVCSSC